MGKLEELEKRVADQAQDITKLRAIVINQQERIAQLEEGVNFLYKEVGHYLNNPMDKPPCKTCKDSGDKVTSSEYGTQHQPCPDCQSRPCLHSWHTLKQPRYVPCCPNCGEKEVCAPKTSCEHLYTAFSGITKKCVKCGYEEVISTDPQPERTLEQKLWKYFEDTGNPIRYEDFYKFAQIAEEFYKDKFNKVLKEMFK